MQYNQLSNSHIRSDVLPKNYLTIDDVTDIPKLLSKLTIYPSFVSKLSYGDYVADIVKLLSKMSKTYNFFLTSILVL